MESEQHERGVGGSQAAHRTAPRETRGPGETPSESDEIIKEIENLRRTFGPSKERDSRPLRWQNVAGLLDRVAKWARDQRAQDAPLTVEKTIKRLEAVAEKLEKKEEKETRAIRSYAAVAKEPAGDPHANRQQREAPKQDPRESRQILVRIADKAAVEDLRQVTTEEIIKRATTGDGDAPTNQIVAARKLPSGDILLYTNTPQEKERLEHQTGWVKKIHPTAETKKRTYRVLIHGMRVADFPGNAGESASKSLQEENERLHPGMNILGYNWLGKIEGVKDYSSLVVEVDSASSANRMINEGVVHRYDLKTTELFDKSYRITQCFQCQKYGHISKGCRETQKCGHCGENHVTESCDGDTDAKSRHCAACDGGNHASWSPRCPARKKEAERANRARANCPRLYPVTTRNTQDPTPNYQMKFFSASQPEPTRVESDSDDPAWEVVDEGKKRRRKIMPRGRPIGSVNKSKTIERTTEQNIYDLLGSQTNRTRTESASQEPSQRDIEIIKE
jgi:hypothetical protein